MRPGPGAVARPPCDAVRDFHQPEPGYRFSEDSIALADFADLAGVGRVADFGAGCGVVGLAALENGRPAGGGAPEGRCAASVREMFFVEREPELLASLEKNVALYRPRTAAKLTVLARDWREVGPADFGGRLDCVLVNPPFFPKNAGRAAARPGRDAARREIHGGLAELLDSLARVLAPGGRLALVFPAARREELEAGLAGRGCSLRRRAAVAPARPGGAPRPVLLEARLEGAR